MHPTWWSTGWSSCLSDRNLGMISVEKKKRTRCSIRPPIHCLKKPIIFCRTIQNNKAKYWRTVLIISINTNIKMEIQTMYRYTHTYPRSVVLPLRLKVLSTFSKLQAGGITSRNWNLPTTAGLEVLLKVFNFSWVFQSPEFGWTKNGSLLSNTRFCQHVEQEFRCITNEITFAPGCLWCQTWDLRCVDSFDAEFSADQSRKVESSWSHCTWYAFLTFHVPWPFQHFTNSYDCYWNSKEQGNNWMCVDPEYPHCWYSLIQIHHFYGSFKVWKFGYTP